jgi:hypothetical protein
MNTLLVKQLVQLTVLGYLVADKHKMQEAGLAVSST